MSSWVNIVLIIHIVAGGVALIAAPVAMIVQKGKAAHRKWGKIYFLSMTIIFISAGILSVVKWLPFLLMVTVFSYYSAVSGYRWTHLKISNGRVIPGLIDWTSLAVVSVFNFLAIGWAISKLITGGYSFYPYLALGFGLGGMVIAMGNLRSFIARVDGHKWVFEHMGGMLGGYIATLTAFSSQMLTFMPGWLQWVWPSILGIPFIAYWIRKYKVQIKQNQSLKIFLQVRS